jgi:EAL domain-containing protein (putative c-di-GMP-specific phosphodiesterase class I)/GGDEF domain-containing protein
MFSCRVSRGHELLYANQNLAEMYECADVDEFLTYVGNSLDGMVNETEHAIVQKEIEFQLKQADRRYGYVLYNIRTKKGNVRRVVNHWALMEDEKEGEILQVLVFLHCYENVGQDIDKVTGLYGKMRFHSFVSEISSNNDGDPSPKYAIAYFNFVNFKLLNIKRGVAEGDVCLKTIADILKQVYEGAFLSRLSDDHFAVFTEYEGMIEKTQKAQKIFMELYGIQYNVFAKCGIYRFGFTPDFDVESALSLAKMACDYIKYNLKKNIAEYSESLEQKVNTKEYVIQKIDEALANDWIKVYYQPVIRSLTGNLCGMESLVRWIDPEIGFLPPGNFIPVLEKEHCIHKLDCYVVEKVCQCLHERFSRNLPVVPVSVNFSRLDFIMCDMLEVVEKAVEKYDVPRDYIHIEVTESMIASDEDLMQEVIEKFRKAGYEIWMDDFGSGYSSLTLLKDYHFDMLKLDMRFLTPFTDKAKEIMRSAISMAKDIGVQTLAEGVETEEQLTFLKEIGCGQIQGYYYGKPEPEKEMFLHLKEKEIEVERRKWRHFYDQAGIHVRASDMPLEIVYDDGKQFKTLYMNRKYKEQIFETDMDKSLEEIDRKIYHTASPLLKLYRSFADKAEKTGNLETFYYAAKDSYLCFRVKVIAENEGHYILKGQVMNITLNENVNDTERLDTKLRGLNLLFDVVLLMTPRNNCVVPLVGGFQYIEHGSEQAGNLQKSIETVIREKIFPTDQKRYSEFIDFSTMAKRVKQSEKGYLMDIFRMRQQDGTYEWKEIMLLTIPGTEGSEHLFCIKSYPAGQEVSRPKDDISMAAEYAMIWQNMVWNAKIKFFWKDKERRFLGVSQSFLDFYGIKSAEELIGKNDEDMHWHVDDELYKNDELAVIREGKKVFHVPGQCIVKGVVHNILCDKMPLYENGEIVGLVGYFVDRDEKYDDNTNQAKKDRITDLMNVRAFLNSMIDYAEQYNEKGRNYGLIVMRNRRHERIVESYGEKFANKVLRVIAERILKVTGQTCAVARIKESVFAVLTYPETEQNLYALEQKLLKELGEITKVDGNSVTMRMKSVVKLRNEKGLTDENIYEKALQELADQSN